MSNANDFIIENGVLTNYTGPGGDVVIPDGVTSIGCSAFECCNNLSSVIIPDSVTSIGMKAFRDCQNLKRIKIPNGVTSISDRMFQWCGNLTDIEIPDCVTSIGECAFCCCSSLSHITIPNGVTHIGNSAFRSCQGLTNIILPDSLTSVEPSVFKCCKGLTNIQIPNGVSSIGESAFEECSNLTSITIPNSVSYIGRKAFQECAALTDITWPSALAKELQIHFPQMGTEIILHIDDISGVSTKFRSRTAVGFAEDERDCTGENGKKYLKYIKANATKLIGVAIEHPALLYLMIREKLIAAKDLEVVTNAVQQSGNAELIAAILEYGNSSISEKEKAKSERSIWELEDTRHRTVRKNRNSIKKGIEEQPSALDVKLENALLKQKLTKYEIQSDLKETYGLVLKNLPEVKCRNEKSAPSEVVAYLLLAHGSWWENYYELPGIGPNAAAILEELDMDSFHK